MAWIKVPPEHHPLFHAALPKDPRVDTQLMFGGIAAKVNGNIFAGLFGRSAMVLLGDEDREAALALDGAGPFDPMGDGRARSDKIMLPEDVFHDPPELREWLRRAFEFTATLPKKAKPAKKAAAKRPAAGTPRGRPVSKAAGKAPAATRAAKQRAAKKGATGAAKSARAKPSRTNTRRAGAKRR